MTLGITGIELPRGRFRPCPSGCSTQVCIRSPIGENRSRDLLKFDRWNKYHTLSRIEHSCQGCLMLGRPLLARTFRIPGVDPWDTDRQDTEGCLSYPLFLYFSVFPFFFLARFPVCTPFLEVTYYSFDICEVHFYPIAFGVGRLTYVCTIESYQQSGEQGKRRVEIFEKETYLSHITPASAPVSRRGPMSEARARGYVQLAYLHLPILRHCYATRSSSAPFPLNLECATRVLAIWILRP